MLLLDGRSVATVWQEELRQRITSLKKGGIEPGLGIILVGDDPASVMYTRLKQKIARSLGMAANVITLPTSSQTADVIAAIERLNGDRSVDGLIVQLPLPEGVDTNAVLAAIDRHKDADGLHPESLGNLLIGNEKLVPATPKGIIRLMTAYNLPISGKHFVIIGRSNILGKPLAAMFVNRDATVTICHSQTKDLTKIVHQADVVILDTGVPNLLTEAMVHRDLIVIDAGITKLPSGRVVGDVDFAAVAPKVRAITPVPGGVGPMTIAALLDNTLELAESAILQSKL